MRKIISVIMLALLLFVVTGCKEEVKVEERTYMADGTYMAWRLESSESTLLMPDGSKYVDPVTALNIKVSTPVLTTVTVLIHNDEVVSYVIDVLQSKPYVATDREGNVLLDTEGYVTKATWKFNDKTKKELEYGYGMEASAKQGEWYIQALKLEQEWLKKGPNKDVLTSVTISHDNLVDIALEALQKAKDGKVSAITDSEHYTYDVTFVNGDINAEGKISNLKLDAQLFGNAGANTYDHTHADYLKFSWNPETKYESYGAMRDGAKWQDQMDAVNAYINANGWDGSVVTGRTELETYEPNNGLNVGGTAIETLTSVTIQLNREVLVMNMLYKFFPNGLTK